MVPNVAGKGTSFKGAALYYLHDKRQEGESVRLTSERVAWSETRNLATDNPELAWKIMAATALDQDRLKAEAGVKATGRKSNAAVYAYSIAWHPDEKAKLTRAEMVQAAEASIRAIGAGDRQAIIVAHNDEPHPHVHVILNRVSPSDGRMLGSSNDRLKLSEWALAYREARGEADLYCPERAKNIEARKKGEYVRASSDTPRSLEAFVAGAKIANDNSALRERDRQKALSRDLASRTRAASVRHKEQWRALLQDYREKKAAISADVKTGCARARSAVRDQFRPSWGEMYRRHGLEERQFKEREKTLTGKLENAIAAIAHRRELDPDHSRGFVSDAFNYLLSRRAREDSLAKLHALEKRRLSAEQNRETRAAVSSVRSGGALRMSLHRKAFAAEREALVSRQDGERAEIRQAWSARRQEAGRAFDRIKRAEHSKTMLAEQRPKGSDGSGVRSAYERAADLAAQVRRRSKERKRDKDRGERDR